jgi:hypothetical protein
MSRVVPAARRVAVGIAAATTLSLGLVTLAGAATATSPSSPSTPTPALRQFNCARAPRVLARIQKVEAQVAAGLPKLHAAETKAKSGGHTKAAARIQRRISRLDSQKRQARLDRRATAIETKCGVTAPAASSSTAPSTAPSAAPSVAST